MTKTILLVGAGPMAVEYAKVLKELKRGFLVIGRGIKSAEEFEKATGVRVVKGRLNEALDKLKEIPEIAVVAVSEEQLGIVTLKLIERDVKSILVEKPAGLDFAEIKKVAEASLRHGAKIYVGYNRRFYTSVEKAKQIIESAGGISSIFFDFTEASLKIAPLVKGDGVKKNWFLHNSTHVIDLAFFLAGIPEKMCTFTKGHLPWHPKAAIFGGAGITTSGALFSYHANWDAPGRWSVEVMTKKHKLIFKPLEKLQIQDLGTFEIKDVELEDMRDIQFKPGLYKEVESFLNDKKDLCTIKEQEENLKFYQQILDGN